VRGGGRGRLSNIDFDKQEGEKTGGVGAGVTFLRIKGGKENRKLSGMMLRLEKKEK